MLEPIIDHINSRLNQLNIFNKMHGLTEQVRRIDAGSTIVVSN